MRREGEVDFTRRAEPSELPEWMDEPCRYEDFRACLVDLGQCNTLTLAARPTLDFLGSVCRLHQASGMVQPTHADETAMHGAHGTDGLLRVLDVGCGGGDMLRRVERWARVRGVSVELTGIDLNPYAARAAAECTPEGSAIRWLTGDAYSYGEPVDVVISSLFTHHLETPEVVQFLAWSEATARRGWFINDLCREAVPYHLFGLLAGALRWHRFVRHDGPVSFRRSFREADWGRMVVAAGMAESDVRLRRWTPARLCVERVR
jgi:SAM-dependent methyltransferase